MDEIPTYAQLPLVADAPPGSAWGVFGRQDQLGSLNFATPERRAAAARLVRRGAVFNLDLPLHLPAQPFFSVRARPRHVLVQRENGVVQDDYLDGFYPQYSSQWDGLRHMRHPRHGFYNWTSDADASCEVGRLGMEHFARHGIVGRGVLLDVERRLAGRGEHLAPDARRAIPVELLDQVAAEQGVAIQPGDIVLLRTGVGAWLRREAELGELSDTPRAYAGPGLEQGGASVAWLWDHQIAAIASDNLAVEAYPFGRDGKILHHWAIALLGMVFGELFDLEDLAADCADDGVYECFFVAKPLHLRGGVGSPANALAIK